MKRFIIDQLGYAQVEACRRFLVEVPDHITEKQVEELLEETRAADEVEWADGVDHNGVEFIETEVFDPNDDLVPPRVDGLKVIKLSAAAENLLSPEKKLTD